MRKKPNQHVFELRGSGSENADQVKEEFWEIDKRSQLQRDLTHYWN